MSVEASDKSHRLIARLDWLLFWAGVAVLLVIIFTTSRANIAADSVDYYSILQKLTSPDEKPIVPNLHFAEQRSPGYPLAALAAYGFLSVSVEPFVSTKKEIGGYAGQTQPYIPSNPPSGAPPESLRRPPSPARRHGQHPPGPGAMLGSEFFHIPPTPVLLKDVAFRDFYLPAEGSWFRWKTVLALAITSYLFFLAGIMVTARTLKASVPSLPGYCLIIGAIFLSPVLVENVVARPLYATLTAFGASAVFAHFFLTGFTKQSTRRLIIAGLFLGFLVLTRLEVSVFVIALAILLIAKRMWRVVIPTIAASSIAVVVWVAYSLTMYGTPFHLGILRGDINRIGFDLGYIFENLAHPQSGIIFWSPLLTIGLAALAASRKTPLRLLGLSSLVLLILYLVRIPVMYHRTPGELIAIGGIPVTVPESASAMRQLIRSDINRYIAMIAPLAVLGLRDGIGRIFGWWTARRGDGTRANEPASSSISAN